MHHTQELLQAAVDLEPRAIWLSFGEWDALAAPIKKAGITLICQVQHLEQVEPALKAGADIMVGQVPHTSSLPVHTLSFDHKRSTHSASYCTKSRD